MEHPNVMLLRRFDPNDLVSSADIFAEDVVFHFFNPLLPDIQGDYVGLAGIQSFFEKIATLTGSGFKINPVSVTPIGDELVVVHRKHYMVLQGQQIESDVVVVWRIHNGKITEVWDIPSIHS